MIKDKEILLKTLIVNNKN